jgi:hypothetical protein
LKYVKVDRTETGYWLDPTAYIEWLDATSHSLPVGARSFAADPDHYDFHSGRCIKDLRIDSMEIREEGQATVSFLLVLGANQWKHEEDLVIRYDGVTRLDLDVDRLHEETRIWPESRRLGDAQLDEILPAPPGCSHEIQLTGGRLFVECHDLRAGWITRAVTSEE